MITKKKILHISRLAKIQIEEKKLKDFSQNLSKIIDFVEQLENVKNENTPQKEKNQKRTRKDEIKKWRNESLIGQTPQKEKNHCILIPRILS